MRQQAWRDLVGTALGPGVHGVDLGEAAARVVWSALVEPGDGVAGALLAACGPERALRAVEGAVGTGDAGLRGLLWTALEDDVAGADDPDALGTALRAAVGRWGPRLRARRPADTVGAALAVGARLLVPGAPGWPDRVDDLGPHAPVVLWAIGTRADDPATLAVVGSRANTVAGAEAAAEITSAAADSGCAVVSGGAYGIDAVAHRVALAAGATTVAVLAGGIDQLYPVGNTDLLRTVARQGRLLAESPPGTRPSRWRFLARNRLIAALGDATVVVEAGARSGALNTAHHAAQLGRPVFAVPGAFSSSASVGCHRLVADGRAQIVVRPDDPVRAVVAETSVADVPAPGSCSPDGREHDDPRRPGTARHRARTDPLVGARTDPEVLRVLDALGRRPLVEPEIVVRSGMSQAEVADALALAELQGLVVHIGGGWARA
ncbi:DNA-processing protein DprA [uncultured Curtobacterium sp.]|uniref:DNA-processing protein DprA n=1 Tax=uncultured Curtobacterium sp. TaxID=331964 RepID=UPI00258B426D|nr:DNA-processing protein DprA [uncultured Curtobacterium sp.]